MDIDILEDAPQQGFRHLSSANIHNILGWGSFQSQALSRVEPVTLCKSPVETIGFILLTFRLEALAVYSSCHGLTDDEESWYVLNNLKAASSHSSLTSNNGTIEVLRPKTHVCLLITSKWHLYLKGCESDRIVSPKLFSPAATLRALECLWTNWRRLLFCGWVSKRTLEL